MVHNLRGYGGFTQINNLFINRQYGGAPRPPMMGGSIWGGGCCPPPVSDGPGKGFWTAFGITAGLSFLGNLAAAIWGKKDGGQVQQQQQPYAQPYAQQMPYSYTPMIPGYTPRMQQPGIQQQNPTKTNLETAAKMYGYTIIETPDGKFMAISKDKGTVSGTFDEIINGMANGAKKPAEVVENNELSNANNQKNVKEKVNEQENENTPTENNKSKEVVAQENTQYKATKSKATNNNKGVNENKPASPVNTPANDNKTVQKNGGWKGQEDSWFSSDQQFVGANGHIYEVVAKDGDHLNTNRFNQPGIRNGSSIEFSAKYKNGGVKEIIDDETGEKFPAKRNGNKIVVTIGGKDIPLEEFLSGDYTGKGQKEEQTKPVEPDIQPKAIAGGWSGII